MSSIKRHNSKGETLIARVIIADIVFQYIFILHIAIRIYSKCVHCTCSIQSYILGHGYIGSSKPIPLSLPALISYI